MSYPHGSGLILYRLQRLWLVWLALLSVSFTTEGMKMFTEQFDNYSCIGDTITCETGPFQITARIEHDSLYGIDDDDCHNTDQSVTGCTDAQFAKLLKARQSWFDNEWFYCGIVLSVSCNGVILDDHAASLWGIECNYPVDDPNSYLLDVANQLLPEAIDAGTEILEKLKDAG